MNNIEDIIFRIHEKLMTERGINKKSSYDMEIRPQNGITSETIVIFLLDLEEELDIELDEYLPRIRECKTIGCLIDIIKEAYERQKV